MSVYCSCHTRDPLDTRTPWQTFFTFVVLTKTPRITLSNSQIRLKWWLTKTSVQKWDEMGWGGGGGVIRVRAATVRGDNWVNQCAWRAQGRTPGQLPLIAMATAYLPRPGPSSLPSHTTSLTLSVASYTVGVFKKRDRTFFVISC